ncbi:short-chain dehydrogenase [Hyaloraphidium curvatum]|nr:short-chain dehydrogenase [Hyaloraphidium curvatum]
MSTDYIKGSVFVVTGGSSGLGRATVHALVKRGAKVVNLDRQSSDKVIAELGAENVVWPGQVDVSNEAQVKAALAQGLTAFKGLTLRGLVNCAGFSVRGNIIDGDGNPMPIGLFDRIVRVNLHGTYLMDSLVAAEMIKSTPPIGPDGERGVLIHTSSVNASDNPEGAVPYNVAKAAVLALTLGNARELSRWGIRCMTIQPGAMDTPGLALGGSWGQDQIDKAGVFPRRLGGADEFAALVIHIIQNHYLNGSTIRLDGGVRVPLQRDDPKRFERKYGKSVL